MTKKVIINNNVIKVRGAMFIMKDRDRRKLYTVLTLLAAIAVAVTCALSVTFVALGVLFVYGRKHFLVWNEKRKAENAANKEMGIEKGPGLIEKIIAKISKAKTKKAENENNAKSTIKPSTGIKVKPVEFNKMSQAPQQIPQDAPVIVTGPDFFVHSSQSKDTVVPTQNVPRADSKIAANNEHKYEDSNVTPFSTSTRSRFKGIQF